MKSDGKNERGFTLIETLVYLALFTLIIGGLMSASYALFESGDRNQAKAMLQDEENFVIAKIMWALESAKTVSVPAVGTPGSALSVIKYDGSTAQFCLSGVDVKYLGASGSCVSSGVILNNSNVAITALTFTHVGSGSNPEYVQVDITATTKTAQGMTITLAESATRYLRK